MKIRGLKMAEFADVGIQLSISCQSEETCDSCILSEKFCSKSRAQRTRDVYETAEAIVMQWSKEHPEPQYPTWQEWLAKNSILEVTLTPVTSSTTSESKQYIQKIRMMPNFYKPIPATIAEQLGIKPKTAKETKSDE